MKTEWELIFDDFEWETRRMPVYGGWLVRDYRCGSHFTTTFVPDEHHRWEIDHEH